MGMMFVWTAGKVFRAINEHREGSAVDLLFTSFLGAEFLSERMYRSLCPSGLSVALQIKKIFLQLGDLKCPST